MKKICKFLIVGMMLISSTAFGKVVLRMADNHAEDYPTVMGDKYFAELVKERTNGNVIIEVYPGGQLGDEDKVVEQLQFGIIDLVRVSLSPLTLYNDKLNVLMLPYIYDSKEHMFKVLDGEIGEEFLKSLSHINLEGLGWFDSGARNFYNGKRPINTLEDMKGLKIRVQNSEVMLGLVEALGASPTPMSFGEVYSSLQTGVIDGAENNWPSYDSTSHFEVSKYFVEDGHTRIPEMIIINKNKLASLSKEEQKIVRESAKEAALKQREFWEEREKKSYDKVKDKVVITKLSDEEKVKFQNAVKPLYKKLAGKHLDLIEEIGKVK